MLCDNHVSLLFSERRAGLFAGRHNTIKKSMLREQSGILLGLHHIIDLFLVGIGFYLAFVTKLNLPAGYGRLDPTYNYTSILVLGLISFHLSLWFFGVYRQYRRRSLNEIIMATARTTVGGIAGLAVLSYLLHLPPVSRLLFLLFGCYTFLLLAGFKIALYRALAAGRQRDYNTRHILLIGTRQRALSFIAKVLQRKNSGYRIIGCLETTDQAELVGDRVRSDIKVIGTLDDFKPLLRARTIDEIVFAMPLKEIENVHEYIYYAEAMGVNVRVLPDFQIDRIKYYPQTAKVEIEEFLGVSTLALSSTPKSGNRLLVKSGIDYLVAFLGLVLLSPLLLCIAVLIKLTSRGPVLFKQERSGLNGRKFTMYKFRTMVANAEELQGELQAENEMDGPVFKIKKDPRITWIGSFLRRTSLDEVPQFINILKGEMSLVGPRPPIPEEVDKYELWQRRRLSMKPGLTCIWQVSGRNEISFDQWMSMDLEYIDNWSLRLDFGILVRTLREVLFGGGR